MKRYLIKVTLQGSERMFVKTEQELYSSLNWKDGKLRWAGYIFQDTNMTESYFKVHITNLEELLKQFVEVTGVMVF